MYFTEPFRTRVWLVVVGVVLVIPLVLVFVSMVTIKFGNVPEADMELCNYRTTLWFLFGIVLQQGKPISFISLYPKCK